jgi:hypothetical protein
LWPLCAKQRADENGKQDAEESKHGVRPDMPSLCIQHASDLYPVTISRPRILPMATQRREEDQGVEPSDA